MLGRLVYVRILAALTLTAASRAELDQVAVAIKLTPNSRWEIGGYMNAVGAAARSNRRGSQARAEAVRAYLVGRGVPAASLAAVGYASQHPIATNRTAAGRARNNRIEIKRLQ